jgi:16S rRNA (uracil1498-N3)-methyltransferase
MTRVLRLRPGDEVAVFDGTGRELVAALATASPRRARARILREMPRTARPALFVTLAQVMPRGGAMDLVVGKATELGVTRIVPLEAERSVRHASARGPRWRRIAQEAAEQCGRADLPDVTPILPLEEFLRDHPKGVPLVATDPGEGSCPLVRVCQDLRDITRLTLLVGGEGGFSPGELDRLRVHGARLASLGPRLLRAETAALAALTIVQAILGDWGPGEDGWAGTRPVPGGGGRVPA